MRTSLWNLHIILFTLIFSSTSQAMIGRYCKNVYKVSRKTTEQTEVQNKRRHLFENPLSAHNYFNTLETRRQEIYQRLVQESGKNISDLTSVEKSQINIKAKSLVSVREQSGFLDQALKALDEDLSYLYEKTGLTQTPSSTKSLGELRAEQNLFVKSVTNAYDRATPNKLARYIELNIQILRKITEALQNQDLTYENLTKYSQVFVDHANAFLIFKVHGATQHYFNSPYRNLKAQGDTLFASDFESITYQYQSSYIIPTMADLSVRDLNAVYGTGIAYAGVIRNSLYVDGQLFGPSTFYIHDLFHANLNPYLGEPRLWNAIFIRIKQMKLADPILWTRIENIYFILTHEMGLTIDKMKEDLANPQNLTFIGYLENIIYTVHKEKYSQDQISEALKIFKAHLQDIENHTSKK